MWLWNKLRHIFSVKSICFAVFFLTTAAVFFSIGYTAPHPLFVRDSYTPTVSMADATTALATSEDNSSASTAVTTDKISINSATKEQLMLVPGIGETFAQRIIDYRDTHNGFADIIELKNIDGVGESRFQKWKDYFTVS